MSNSNNSKTLPSSVFYSQNYLKDPGLVAALLQQSSISRNDLVYEIGPGKGIITGELAARCRRVIAVEKDPRLAARLVRKFSRLRNISIRAGDFLHSPLPDEPYKVFANIPFNATAAIVQTLTAAANPPEEAYLVMQKEAARMYLGWPRESLRTLCLKPWFETEIVHHFRRWDFTPLPGVDVVLVRLRKRDRPLVPASHRQCYRDFVVYGFTTWRLASGRIFADLFSYRQRKQIHRKLSIDLEVTPTELSLDQWLGLFACFLELDNPRLVRQISGCERRLQGQQRKLQKDHRTRIFGANMHE